MSAEELAALAHVCKYEEQELAFASTLLGSIGN